ncbi:MAG: hypothetical protein ABJE10_14225 [bacterium]
MTSDQKLDAILDALERGRQRATYGAVASRVNRPQRFLMRGRPCDHRHSWIVSKATGLPTGYGPHDMHPDLLLRPEVLSTSQQLEDWLAHGRS